MKTAILIIFILIGCQCSYAQKYKVKEKDGKSALFYNKKNITGYKYDSVGRVIEGTCKVKSDSGWGLIHQTGETLIACRYDTLIDASDDNYIVVLHEKYGVVSPSDEILMEPIYDRIDHYSDTESLSKLDGEWTLKQGVEVTKDWEQFVFNRPEQEPLYTTCNEEQIADGKTDKECSQLKMLMTLYGSIKYPAKARESKVEGTCVIRFVIDSFGKGTNYEIVRDIGAGCGEESLRVVKILDDWTPGKQGGINVSTVYNLPIKFKLR